MAKLLFLTDRERDLMQEFLDKVRGLRVNTPSRPQQERSYSEGQDFQASDVYVAVPPSGGIPARTAETPGSATCDIYKIVGGSLVDAGFDLLVYNISNQIIPKFDERCSASDYVNYISIKRTKFGFWITGAHDDSCPTDTETGTGTGIDCPGIPEVDLDDLTEDANSDYTLGFTDGCLVKVVQNGSCYAIPGVSVDDLAEDTSPAYVIGYDDSGCLVKVPVSECEEETGTS